MKVPNRRARKEYSPRGPSRLPAPVDYPSDEPPLLAVVSPPIAEVRERQLPDLSPMLIRYDPTTTSASFTASQEATSSSARSLKPEEATNEVVAPTTSSAMPSPQSTISSTHRLKVEVKPGTSLSKPPTSKLTTSSIRPTTMAFVSLNLPLVLSLAPTPVLPSHTKPIMGIPNTVAIIQPAATDLLGAETPTAAHYTRTGTTIAIVIVILLALVIVIILIIRRAYVRAKEKKNRFNREELERQFMATKESSFFGGKDYGSFTSEKGDLELGSGPSWVDLPLPPMPPQESKPNSYWMAGGDQTGTGPRNPHAPAVHFFEPSKSKGSLRDSHARDSDDEEGVIATAARISAASVYTTKSQKPSVHLGVGVFGQYDPSQGGQPMQYSPSSFSNASFPSYHQDIYRYDGSTGVNVNASNVPRHSGVPMNTAIGAAASGTHPTEAYPGVRAINPHTAENAATGGQARPREPLRSNKANAAVRTPSRSYHTSFVADTGPEKTPTVKELILARSQGQAGSRQNKENITNPGPRVAVNRISGLSMCTVMLTNYDEEGAILPPAQESPLFSGMLAGVEHWLGETRRSSKRASASNHANGNISLGRSITSKFAGQSSQTQVQVSPRNPPAPRLTITSPSGAVFNGLGVSNSSSSLEDALPSLAQMALASSQSNYRSPTFSIYNMYDGDDEGSGVPRRSIIAQKFK